MVQGVFKEGCGGPDIFNSVYFGVEGVVVLKELIFNSLYLGGCGDFERTDFYQFPFGRVWWVFKNLFCKFGGRCGVL